MLVLSRRLNEKILLPTHDTTIQVISVKSGTVRLGIQAPDSLPVYREEVYAQLPLEQRDALASQALAGGAAEVSLHQINNHINSTKIGLALLRMQLLQPGAQSPDAIATIQKVEQELTALENGLRQSTLPPLPRALPGKISAKTRRPQALLVEDDPNQCELLAGFLRLAGVDVLTAGDGADALNHLSAGKFQPDVVVMDMLLPRCDGPTAVRAIRDNPAHSKLKIIGITGADPDRFNLPHGPTGINRWFHKPLNPEDLLREVQLNAAV